MEILILHGLVLYAQCFSLGLGLTVIPYPLKLFNRTTWVHKWKRKNGEENRGENEVGICTYIDILDFMKFLFVWISIGLSIPGDISVGMGRKGPEQMQKKWKGKDKQDDLLTSCLYNTNNKSPDLWWHISSLRRSKNVYQKKQKGLAYMLTITNLRSKGLRRINLMQSAWITGGYFNITKSRYSSFSPLPPA